jgi:iron complex outermembrane receptor protein
MRKVLSIGVSVLALQASAVAQTIDLGEVSASATTGSVEEDAVTPAKRGTAAAVAPTQGSLYATEPETIINQNFISNIAAPASDYLSIAQFAPSVQDSNPNGAGFDSQVGSIRGFQDGQYNVTFDGIPFSDPFNFNHHTTSYFPAPVIGSVTVDRGPGTASQIGDATFGGTIALTSEQATPDPSGRIFAAYGSANTYQEFAEGDFGSIAATGGTTGYANYGHIQTDGLLQEAGQRQDNYVVKLQQPVGSSTVLTVFSEYDDMDFQAYFTQPLSQTDLFGISYGGLNTNPNSQNYFLYNINRRRADFDYFGIQSDQGIFRFDNKVYTYDLDDHTEAGVVQQISLPNQVLLPQGGVPGIAAIEFYRAIGDVAKLEADFGSGFFATTVKLGVWTEFARETNSEQSINLITQKVTQFNPLLLPSTSIINNRGDDNTTQTFIEFDWTPLPGLTVIPGFKHIDFSRDFQGNSGLGTPNASNSQNFSVNLGSTEINYRVTPQLSTYAEWATGFQAPQVNVVASPNAQTSDLSPQQTINYQTGVVWKSDRLVADLDGYYINFRNAIGSEVEPFGLLGGTTTVFFNEGGVIYKGIEAEATYVLGDGFSITGNGSLNSAAVKRTGLQIANSPVSTAAAGVIYDQDDLFGSVLTKYVGHSFAGPGELPAANPNVRVPSYNFTDLSVGYRLPYGLKAEFRIDNLLDHHTETLSSGSTTSTPSTFYYLASRFYEARLSVGF